MDPLDVLNCLGDYGCEVNVHISEQLDQLLVLSQQLELASKALLVAVLAIIGIVIAWKVVTSVF